MDEVSKASFSKYPTAQDFGATALWLTPVCDNVTRPNQRETYRDASIADYHGYGAADFYAVDEHFGTPRQTPRTRPGG
jgi:glycosidase